MDRTTENFSGIMTIISMLQRKHQEKPWGDYKEHYLTETNEYQVFFTNNVTIKIHRTIAQDAEIDIRFVTDESLEIIIETYKFI